MNFLRATRSELRPRQKTWLTHLLLAACLVCQNLGATWVDRVDTLRDTLRQVSQLPVPSLIEVAAA